MGLNSENNGNEMRATPYECRFTPWRLRCGGRGGVKIQSRSYKLGESWGIMGMEQTVVRLRGIHRQNG